MAHPFGVAGDIQRFGGGASFQGTVECVTSMRVGSSEFNAGCTRFAVLLDSGATPLSGATYTFTGVIPAGAIVLGVTSRVLTAVTGAASTNVGDGTTANKFGNLANALASTVLGSITPVVYASAANVVLTAVTSNFTAGRIRCALFYDLLDTLDG